MGVEDEEFGQRLKAFVVRREGAQLDEEAVKAYVKANLARYKVPREVVFMERTAAQRNRQGAQARVEDRRVAAGGPRRNDDQPARVRASRCPRPARVRSRAIAKRSC